MPRSYKVGVKTYGDKGWSYNGLRFATRADAVLYGHDLYARWMAVEAFEVHESDDEPNREEADASPASAEEVASA